jgi:ATP-dependent Zn protease
MKGPIVSKLLDQIISNARPVALHEAGHNVIASAVGLRTGYLEIEATPLGCSGKSEIDLQGRIDSLDELQAYLRRRIAALYAGSIAQTLTNQGIDEQAANDFLQRSAADDFTKIQENLRILANVTDAAGRTHKEHLTTLHEELSREAKESVLQNRAKIQRAADALVAKIDGDALTYRLTKGEIDAL